MSLALVNTMTAVSMQENKMAVQTVQAQDSLGGTVSYAITGGADAAKFSIDAATGALSFIAAPDYDVPEDADKNNVYSVEVTATSTSASAPLVQLMTVTITAANDALEKSLDLARVAGEAIEVQNLRNDEQDARLDSAEGDIDALEGRVTTAEGDIDALEGRVTTAENDIDTLQTQMAGKADQTALDQTNTNVTNVSNRVSAVENYFDANHIIKLENLPEQVRTGMKPLGTFQVGVDTLPAATVANEWQYYIVDNYGSVDLSAAQDGSKMVAVAPKGWIISTGDTGWAYIAGGDGLTSVNGKTAENGAVTVTSQDLGYTPSEASGLTATTAKAGIDEVGVKLKEVSAALGDVTTYDPVAVFTKARATRRAQGL